MNEIITMLKPSIQTFLGAIITLVCTLLLYKYQFKIEINKEVLKYQNEKNKKYQEELKYFFKYFTKHYRVTIALNSVFTLYLKKEIEYQDWICHTKELQNIDIDEIIYMQYLYMDTDTAKDYFKLYSELSTIMLNFYNTKFDKSIYLETLSKFSLVGEKYQKEIIKLIKENEM
jgi:hypothetical protein